MRLIDADALKEYIHNQDGRLFIGITIGEAFQMMVDEQPTIEEREWIPCGEQLPQQGQEVICQCRANMIKVLKLDAYGDWYQDAEHCYMSGFVIAWIPLPEPYEEENR